MCGFVESKVAFSTEKEDELFLQIEIDGFNPTNRKRRETRSIRIEFDIILLSIEPNSNSSRILIELNYNLFGLSSHNSRIMFIRYQDTIKNDKSTRFNLFMS